ncbi:MAG: hypothetical protein OEM97_10115, partial [Acidimicrobiia bacterium]|nr:hypothetical protein [Acidimicrobiia bacterium]
MSADDPRYVPTDEELRAARHQVENLLAASGVELSEPALWEPAPDLEDAIMSQAAGGASTRRRRTPRLWLAAAVIVAVAAVGLVAFAAFRTPPPDWSVALAAT